MKTFSIISLIGLGLGRDKKVYLTSALLKVPRVSYMFTLLKVYLTCLHY